MVYLDHVIDYILSTLVKLCSFHSDLYKYDDMEKRGVILKRRRVITKQNNMEEFLKTLPNSRGETNVDNECPVCFADVEDPYVLTLCGHAYCSACITQYLSNVFDSVKSADMFPRKCIVKDVNLLPSKKIKKLYRVP